MKRTGRAVVLSLAVLALPGRAASGQSSALEGRVVDSRTGDPLPTAQVVVGGARVGALSGVDGSFRLAGIPEADSIFMRVDLIGYCPWVRLLDADTPRTGMEVRLDRTSPPSTGRRGGRRRGAGLREPLSTGFMACMLAMRELEEGQVRRVGDDPDVEFELAHILRAMLADSVVAERASALRGDGPLGIVVDEADLGRADVEGAPFPVSLMSSEAAVAAIVAERMAGVVVMTVSDLSEDRLSLGVHFETPTRPWFAWIESTSVLLERVDGEWRLR